MSNEHTSALSKDQTPIAIFWFRRDLRIEDNTALAEAMANDIPVLPIFIYDRLILNELPEDDLIRIGGNVEVNEEQNQAKGEESLAALKSLFS